MSEPRDPNAAPGTAFLLRSAVGGVLMGLANLVPGISGGTMLLAAGIYTDFIEAVAGLTRLRPTRRMIVTLACVGGSAALAILLLAGTIKDLVVDHRWIMYSLFIGLTLGGVPTLWRMARPASRPLWIGAAVGFVAMAALALAQQSGSGTIGTGESSYPMLLVAGTAGAASMILPGISGGYMLLILGQYVPILSAIDRAVQALRAADLGALLDPVIGVFVPVGIGLVLGVAVVSNLLRAALHRYEAATLGVLLGLLLGCIVGLWPFQEGTPPQPGDVVKGQVVTAETITDIDPEDWPVRRFTPTGGQVGASFVLILTGAAVTTAVAAIGGRGETG